MQVLNFEDFVDFLIDFGLKIDDWAKDEAYVIFIKQYLRRESSDVALERSIKFMEKWSRVTGHHWTEFFNYSKDNELSYWIQTGRISPWVVLCCEGGQERLGNFKGEHMKMALENISPRFWGERLDKYPEDVAHIKEVLKAVGM